MCEREDFLGITLKIVHVQSVLVTAVFFIQKAAKIVLGGSIKRRIGSPGLFSQSFGELYIVMQKESQTKTAVSSGMSQEDVVLNLTISGAREQILCLLEQMDHIAGFSVLKGSFIVSNARKTPV